MKISKEMASGENYDIKLQRPVIKDSVLYHRFPFKLSHSFKAERSEPFTCAFETGKYEI